MVSFWGCYSNDDVYQDDQNVKEQLYLGEVVITPLNVSRGVKDFTDTTSLGDVKIQIGFRDEDEDSQLRLTLEHITIDNESQMYACMVDSSETPDFFIEPIDEAAGTYRYLNASKQPLQDCSLEKDPLTKEWTLTVLQNYDNPVLPLDYDPAKEKWGDCFNRRIKSETGAILLAFGGILGPEGVIGVFAGAALSCVIWTPY